MMHQLGESIPRPPEQQEEDDIFSETVERAGGQLHNYHDGYNTGVPANHGPMLETHLWNTFSAVDESVLDAAADGGDWPLNDALYGLYAPDQSFM